MATGKTYYWIKLKDSFATDDVIDFLMSQPNGSDYVVLYQMLCLKTINTSGRLERRIGEMIIPFDIDKIARECKWFSVDTIRVALELFKRIGLIYEDVDGSLIIANYDDMVGSETDYSAQKRRQRLTHSGPKQIENVANESVDTTVDNAVDNVHTEIRDKILEIREEKKKDKRKRDYTDEFEEVWAAYPRKKDKQKAYKAYCARLKDGWGTDVLLDATKAYAQDCRKRHTTEEYIKLCSTFFSAAESFVDYIQPDAPPEPDDGAYDPFFDPFIGQYNPFDDY